MLVDGLVEGGVSRPSRIETAEPLGDCVLNLDVVPLDFPLQPQ